MEKLKAVLGITNKTEDNKHIPFLDFDSIDYPNLILTLGKIQKDFNLSFCFIVKSTNGYNAFFLDKLTFDNCIEICNGCEYVDPKFIEYAIKKNNFTLRIGKDKKFLSMLPSPSLPIHQLSYAHYSFFNEFFKVDILNGIEITEYDFDMLSEIQLVRYMSKKYGYIEVD